MADESQYLLELENRLGEYVSRVRQVSDLDDAEIYNEVHGVFQEALKAEQELRQQYDIGVRFNIIRRQLHDLSELFEKTYHSDATPVVEEQTNQSSEDNVLVYLYLFNVHGNVLKTWKNLLSNEALVEHSVNRPIYQNEHDIQEMLRSKNNSGNHAYIAVVVNKKDVLKTIQSNQTFSLLRLRQGAAHINHIKYFAHENKKYSVSSDGVLALI